jgi:hypothetical protein
MLFQAAPTNQSADIMIGDLIEILSLCPSVASVFSVCYSKLHKKRDVQRTSLENASPAVFEAIRFLS